MKITEAQLRRGIRKIIRAEFNEPLQGENDMHRVGGDDAYANKAPPMLDNDDYMEGYEAAIDAIESFRRQELQRYPNRGQGGGYYGGD